MEIKEVFDDLQDKVGTKGLLLIGGALGLVFLISYTKQSREEAATQQMSVVTGYTSYPDVVTNANVIMDSIQNSIDYSEQEIIQAIGDSAAMDMDYLDQHFAATNDFIQSGFESQKEILETNQDVIMGSIADTQSAINSAINNKAEINQAIKDAIAQASKQQTSTPTTSTPTSTQSKPATSKPATTQYYKYTTKAGLNTSTSIVDALKAAGEDSSFSHRAEIAAANGINNYTGTATQNIVMLRRMKNGTLKKA